MASGVECHWGFFVEGVYSHVGSGDWLSRCLNDGNDDYVDYVEGRVLDVWNVILMVSRNCICNAEVS